MKDIPVTLEDLAGGKVPAMFEKALQEVVLDLDDPMKDPLKTRSITIKVNFRTNEDRKAVAVDASCKVDLAPWKRQQKTTAYLSRTDGVLSMVEVDPEQQRVPMDRVIEFRSGRDGGDQK
ncbi:MAG: hypothetical protein AAGN66_05550 [Acidobacteriota bacterium]